MTDKKQETENWLTSKEAQKVLKVSSCELMHLRVVGKLPYKKQGNAYFYQIPKQPES
ncbi:hypothetical protein ORJ00_07925 [Rheinheimera baltica]|uniref:hypothetical protein n=1 Tax=Rheinheimera baltica TaxID=67576 RepID=UPI00273D0685|nr:hypothetical protein [Rheinheimera baltica]MDP5142662.1 hypothetical protein [Rheinheimera baltica]